MLMTFVGVGNGLAPQFGNNNVLLEGDELALLDCGSLTPARLFEEGVLRRVRHFLVTHVHADHVGGLELVAHLNRYFYRERPHLYFHEDLWTELWDETLRGGLERSQDGEGNPERASLADYFELHHLDDEDPVARIPGLPPITFVPTLHVAGKPAFSLYLGEDIYYSSDSQLSPPPQGLHGQPLRAIFQDCQIQGGKANVHATYEELKQLPPELKRITHLMHFTPGFEKLDALADGFAGFVQPGQRFEFD